MPEAVTLSELTAELLEPEKLPGLWREGGISVQDVCDYFAGGHNVTVQRDGYEETVTLPKCDLANVEAAVSQAVEKGLVWLTNGPASILNEPLPAGVLSASAILRPPPRTV